MYGRKLLFRKRQITVNASEIETQDLEKFSPWTHFKAQGAGSIMSVLSGNPADDAEFSKHYKGLDASEYLSRINTFQKPVTRTTKDGEDVRYNTVWIEHERGAHAFVYINSLGLSEDLEPIRVPVAAIMSCADPDFLERVVLGSNEERAGITEEELRHKIDITLTRTLDEITSQNTVNGKMGTYFNMGWAAEAIQDDTTKQRDFMRHKGTSKESGDHIIHSASTIVWREPEFVPWRHRLADKLRPWKEPRKADPNKYVSRLYYNEFGKVHMRIKPDDMKVGFIRWMMRHMSADLNKGQSLNEKESKKLMHEGFEKALWAEKHFEHPFDFIEGAGNILSRSAFSLSEVLKNNPKKPLQKAAPILNKTGEFFESFTNKWVKKIGKRTPQKYGHYLVNFNKKGTMIAVASGAAIGIGLVAAMYVFGVLKVATTAAYRYSGAAIAATIFKKAALGMTKGGAKVLSPIIPLTFNKRFDKSPVIADCKPKLRQNDDLGGWTLKHAYFDHLIPFPYDFVADTFPDAPLHTKADREQRVQEMLMNPDSLADGTHSKLKEIMGRTFFVAREPTGITRSFDTASLTVFSQRSGEPSAFCAPDGAIQEKFDSLSDDKPVLAVRWKDFWAATAQRLAKDNADESKPENDAPSLIAIESIESVPDEFIKLRTQSIEQFAEEVCPLDNLDTADFVPQDYLSAKQLKKIAKKKIKQQKTQAKIEKVASAHKIEFERKSMNKHMRARAANENLSLRQRCVEEFIYDDHGIG